MGKPLNNYVVIIILIFVTMSFVVQNSKVVGKWRGLYLTEPLELEFTGGFNLITKFRNQDARFKYEFINDSMLRIGEDTHYIYVITDSLLILKPFKFEKDISILDIVEFHKKRN